MPAKHQIAPLTILAQQLHAVALEIERMPDSTPTEQDRRTRWENAAITAFNELAGGTHYTRHDDGSATFRSRSRPRLEHTANQNGACTCEAFTEKHIPCWHLPALWMLDGCEEALYVQPSEAAAVPATDDAPIHCPYCAAPMFPAVTPGGEDVIECSNLRCQKVCYLDALDYFLSRMPDAEGLAVLTLARPKEPAHA
jgi:hypothetical protein